jgi:TPR repeat protein
LKEEAEAVRCFSLAVDQNDVDAPSGYAVCLAKGRGVPKNEVEAARDYKQAD